MDTHHVAHARGVHDLLASHAHAGEASRGITAAQTTSYVPRALSQHKRPATYLIGGTSRAIAALSPTPQRSHPSVEAQCITCRRSLVDRIEAPREGYLRVRRL